MPKLWIKDGRVAVNGKVIRTPAFNVTAKDQIKVDGQPLAATQGTARLALSQARRASWSPRRTRKAARPIFQTLEEHGLPRVVSIGRLDINTEGLLLLTNDGGLKRVLELPATGWLRRYRVRAFGTVTQPQLDALKDGIEVEGVKYGPIEAVLERQQGSNVWLVVSLREGKNREVKNVLAALGLAGQPPDPRQLRPVPARRSAAIGAVEVVKARILREQLGNRLADEAGVDFDSELPEQPPPIELARGATNPTLRAAAPGKSAPKQRKAIEESTAPFRFVDRDQPAEDAPRQRRDRPGGRFAQKRPMAAGPAPHDREEPAAAHHPPRGRHHQPGPRPPAAQGTS